MFFKLQLLSGLTLPFFFCGSQLFLLQTFLFTLFALALGFLLHSKLFGLLLLQPLLLSGLTLPFFFLGKLLLLLQLQLLLLLALSFEFFLSLQRLFAFLPFFLLLELGFFQSLLFFFSYALLFQTLLLSCKLFGLELLLLLFSDTLLFQLFLLNFSQSSSFNIVSALLLGFDSFVDNSKDFLFLLLSFPGRLGNLLVKDSLDDVDIKGQIIQHIQEGSLNNLGCDNLALLLRLVLALAADVMLQQRVIQHHGRIQIGQILIGWNLVGFGNLDTESGFSVGLNEIPQGFRLLKVGVLLQHVRAHDGRANQAGAGQSLNQWRILEIIKNLLDSFDSLEFAQLLRIHIEQITVHFKARGIDGHFKCTFHIFFANFKAVLKKNRSQIVAIYAVIDCGQSFTDKVLQIDQQSIDKTIFIGFEAFFFEDVQNLVGSHAIVFDLGNHIGVLRKMSYGLRRNLSCKLNVYNLFFLNNKPSRISDDIIQGYDGIFDSLHPS